MTAQREDQPARTAAWDEFWRDADGRAMSARFDTALTAYRRALLPEAEGAKLVECPRCGGSGFETPGTGYDNVCSECGGQKQVPAPGASTPAPAVAEEVVERIRAFRLNTAGPADIQRFYDDIDIVANLLATPAPVEEDSGTSSASITRDA